MKMPSYNPADIERRWQAYWAEHKTFRTPDGPKPGQPKCYVLDMFPYPSGAGLHVGHPEGYTATDILCRFRRNRGFHVLHPMGWDAFGLPAEQYAIKTNTHPRITTVQNIATFRRQIQALGFSYDWDREVDTTDPSYFKWTQWIFLLLYDTWYDPVQKRGRPISELPIPAGLSDDANRKFIDDHRLTYQAEVPVNWCPAMGTVLSNEEVIDGKSEVGGHPVERRPLKQWLMRITAYSERLLNDLEPLDWSEGIKQMQRNWIGKSEGAEVIFKVDGSKKETITVFTTRPDTLFGATYMVLSPEHPLVDAITTADQKSAVKAYQDTAARKSDFERTEMAKAKTGVFTGAFAINPANGKKIPVWIADYVLSSYGTGAIMAVPGQDERDWEFAEVYNLPIVRTVQTPADWKGKAFLDDGPAINSGFLDGLHVDAAKAKMIAWLEEKTLGTRRVNYKLRDWLFSRQRYWGEPFPLLHEVNNKGERTGVIRPLTEKDLPLTLPDLADFQPTGTPEGPLSKAKDWVNVTLDGKRYQRETNTMPQWAGSCWYYLRYIDPKNDAAFADVKKLKHWLPVDLYVGGAEHAVLHLLYSRFWHKVLFDRGYLPCPEPFQRLVNQGMILGENGEKMSKSRGNVVNPDDVIREYGADSMRLYEMFMGPLEAVKPWNMHGVEGVYRFLGRVWRLIIDDPAETMTLNTQMTSDAATGDTLREMHRTIQKVTEDTEGLRFNTAISAMMEFTNHLTKLEKRPKAALEALVLLLSPYAPHMAEELWRALGHQETLAYAPWPTFDAALTKSDTLEIPVSINGKLKAVVSVAADADKDALEAAAKAKVADALAGKAIKKTIVVPKKMVNFVIV